jgi:hypothetical protein
VVRQTVERQQSRGTGKAKGLLQGDMIGGEVIPRVIVVQVRYSWEAGWS